MKITQGNGEIDENSPAFDISDNESDIYQIIT